MIKFLSPWLIPAMCMLCIMFALAVSRAYWLYRFLPLFLPHGRLQPCAVKISNTMKFSKAAQISIDYHKTHSKKKYSAIIPGHHRAVYPGIWWLPHRPGHPGTHPYLSEPPHQMWSTHRFLWTSSVPWDPWIECRWSLRTKTWFWRHADSARWDNHLQ